MSAPAYLRIADELASEILNGSLAPDSRLPTTKALAERYGVAVNTAQQSMKLLAERGLVQRRPKFGTVVSRGATATSIAIVLGTDVFADDERAFHRVLLGHIQQLLADHGWATTVHLAARPDSRRAVLEGVFGEVAAGRARALLLLSSAELETELADELARRCDVPWTTTRASIDQAALARRAVGHLLERGHRDIVLLPIWPFDGGDARADAVKAGALEAFAAHGVTPPADAFAYRGASARIGLQAVEQMLANRGRLPSAVASLHDRATLGLVMGLCSRGLRIGQDVAVISHANLGIDILSPLPLTTVAYHPADFAAAAWNSLRRCMHGEPPEPDYLVPGRLIPGASC